jgi:hypothetical protein
VNPASGKKFIKNMLIKVPDLRAMLLHGKSTAPGAIEITVLLFSFMEFYCIMTEVLKNGDRVYVI